MYIKGMEKFNTIIEQELKKLLPEIIEFRKELHKNPETAWKEFNTQKRILQALSNCDINLHAPYLETDIVFDMGDSSKKPGLLLRSDMDALCQQEMGDIPYKSVNNGIAHSCGHDGHMSMLTGAAILIDRLVKKGFPLPKPVRFVFQPAEELECGGSKLVAAGVLNNIDNVLAIHGWPGLPKGELFSKPGPFFAAEITFSFTVKGKATHGGLPQNGISPFPAVAELIKGIQVIHGQYKDKAIVSSCNIHGGASDNIITENIELRGTIRYFDLQYSKDIKVDFGKLISGIEQRTNCTITPSYRSQYYLPVANDNDFLSSLNKELQRSSSGYPMIPNGIKETCAKTVSEDFAFYTDKKPGALLLLGLGEGTPSLHATNFNFPEEVIKKGILLFLTAAYNM